MDLLPSNIKVEDETYLFDDKLLSFLSTKSENDAKHLLTQLKLMLIELMMKNKSAKNEEYVFVLVKLCAECKPELISDENFLKTLPLSFCLPCIQTLRSFNRHHSAALIYSLMNQNEEAFEIWKK